MKSSMLFILIACTIQSTFTMEKNTTPEEALLKALIKFRRITFQEKEVLDSAVQVAQKVFTQKITNLAGAKTDKAKAVATREVIGMKETLRLLSHFKEEADHYEARRERQMREWDVRMAEERKRWAERSQHEAIRRWDESSYHLEAYNRQQQKEASAVQVIRRLIEKGDIVELSRVLQNSSLDAQSIEGLVHYASELEKYDMVQILFNAVTPQGSHKSDSSTLSNKPYQFTDINNSNN